MFFRKQFGDFHGKKLVSLEENLPSEKNQTKQHSHILQVYDPDLDLLSKFGARYALKPGGQIKLGWHSDATRAWSMTKKNKNPAGARIPIVYSFITFITRTARCCPMCLRILYNFQKLGE